MALPWKTLASVPTDEGTLELRQRGEREFLILVGGRVLMTSVHRRTEEALATVGCAPIATRPGARVLVGGLGMGFTLRAALDALPKGARVTMAELNPVVVQWCRGPLAPLTDGALADPRVTVEVRDVARVIAEAPPSSFDAILLDLYEGPHAATQRPGDPFYGAAAIARQHAALGKKGVLAVWSEDPDAPYQRRLTDGGFAVTVHRAKTAGRAHLVYLAVRS